ncbi:hypothetical protein FPOAC2_05246 [Fusarium poae]|jgi:hypothetical protein
MPASTLTNSSIIRSDSLPFSKHYSACNSHQHSHQSITIGLITSSIDKGHQVTVELIVQSAVLRTIALQSHTVWYGARPTDRVLLGLGLWSFGPISHPPPS